MIGMRPLLFAFGFSLLLSTAGFAQPPKGAPPRARTPEVLPSPASAVSAEELGRRLDALTRRIDALETRPQKAEENNAEALVAAVGDVAKLSMASTDRNVETMKWFIGTLSIVAPIIIGGFALLGYRKFRDIIKPMRREHRSLLRRVGEERRRLSAITEELDRHRNDAVKNIEGLVHVTSAFSYVVASTSTEVTSAKNDYLVRALRDLDKTVEQIRPADLKVLGWAQSMRGYCLSRLRTPEEALLAVEQALATDPTNERAWYNAACYAARLRQIEKCLRYLAEAISRNAQFALDAIEDRDFENVRNVEGFRRLTTGRG